MSSRIGFAELTILLLLAMVGWLSAQFPFLRPAMVLVVVIGFLLFGLRSMPMPPQPQPAPTPAEVNTNWDNR